MPIAVAAPLVFVSLSTEAASRTCNLRSHGASGLSVIKPNKAIQTAIDGLAPGRGGTVETAVRTFLSGPVVSRDHITQYVDVRVTVGPGITKVAYATATVH